MNQYCEIDMKKPIFHLGSFESTKIHGTSHDVLSTTHHLERWHDDLELLLSAGIDQLRYPAPWHRIETEQGCFDWSWMDGPMMLMRDRGMAPVIDALHHTSFPDWLCGGFANPDFPALYERFLAAFAARYEWVRQYTVFNEPLPTTLFCSYTGMWYPHDNCDGDFVRTAVNVGKAICRGSSVLRRTVPTVELIHIDTCERHNALDQRSVDWVDHANERRYMMHDLILGKIRPGHPLYGYMTSNGIACETLRWFEDNAATFDVLGLDYYSHSELDWYWDEPLGRANIGPPCGDAAGFAALAMQYLGRFRTPIMLAETNLRGSVTDRLTWLKFMERECEELVRRGIDFRGFCWYPAIDSTDWSNCCTKCTRIVDPQGIWGLDQNRWQRHTSELSYFYAQLAQHRITSLELPSYSLSPPLQTVLRGYSKLIPWGWIGCTEVAA
jgi:beta-glucosidase